MSFERLLYTDCRAGQGRSGGGGFQIQAQSAGVTSVLAKMAVETLLYARQTEWVGSARAIEDFPLGLAHSARDGWGTAQSRYLGQEATGGRQGNHLADCLLTTDPEPYGAIRPAQLFASELWRGEPFEGIDCPPFDGFLEPGPLTNDDIQDWLREGEGRAEVLKRLVSVLLNPDGPKVVILANATEDAVRWIAAATMLLPIRDALDVSFKVFVSSVSQASQRIVGVPRDLNPNIKVDGSDSRFVIDATDNSSGAFETTALADFWVDRLVEAEDAYDVVEAVDLAYVLGGQDSTLAANAYETAWTVTAEGETPQNPSRLLRWLKAPKDPSLAEYESTIASRLIEANLADPSTLLWMELQADAGRLSVDRVSLREAVLTAEVAAAPTAFNERSDELSSVEIGDEIRRDAESNIGSAILRAKDGGAVDRLLRTAKRHGLQLEWATPLDARLHDFIADWIAHPKEPYDPGVWALSDNLVSELRGQLSSATAFAGGYSRVRPLLYRTWTHLIKRMPDPSSPLACELVAASVAHSHESAKLDRVRTVIQDLAKLDDGGEALANFQRALVAWYALSGRETMVVAEEMLADVVPPRRGLAPEFAELLWVSVCDEVQRPDRLLLDCILRLRDWNQLPSNTIIDAFWRADELIATFLVVATEIKSDADLERLGGLKRVDPAVLRIRLPEFVDVSIGNPLPTVGLAVLDRLPSTWHRDFFSEWRRMLAQAEHSVNAAARGYLWCITESRGLSGWERDYVETQIAEFASRLDESRRAQWIRRIERQVGGEPGALEDFISHQGKGLRHKLTSSLRGAEGPPSIIRPKRGRSEKED